MQKNKVTIKYLAAELGIAISTVSRALHNAYDVSPETREKVLALAEKLNYKPNPNAISLVKRQTKIIGVLLPEIATHYFSTVIKGIQDVAYKLGYSVMFFISDESIEREKIICKNFNPSSIDGLLVSVSSETSSGEHFEELMHNGLPIVFFDRILTAINTSKVIQDDYQGAYNATLHLIEQGYKKIAHLAGPKVIEASQKRVQGYIDALEAHQLPVLKKYIIHSGFTQEDGIRSASKLLTVKPLPDAIFAVNDRNAIGAMVTLKRYGYDIPNHFGLVGFTNAPIAEVVTPSLTTIEQAAYEIGVKSCNLLLQHIKNPNFEPQTIIMPSKLIVRASSIKSKNK